MSRPVTIRDIAVMAADIAKVSPEEINIAALDRTTVGYVDLADSEKKVINHVFDAGLNHLRKVAPSIAAEIEKQRGLAIAMAGVAKATFPKLKPYSFPSIPGQLSVAWLFPQAIKWVANPDATNPAFTSYKPNSWDIDVTAGTPAYLFGSATDFYRTSRIPDQNSFILIFNNGVVEIGSTPTIDQFQLVSEAKTDYGIYSVEPLVEIPVEKNVTLYQYPTPLGALFIDNSRGVRWSFMSRVSGTKTIKLLGLVYYEHDFLRSLKWV